jgi:hypothetical protein
VLSLDAALAPGTLRINEGRVNGQPTTMLGKTQGGSGPQAVRPVAQLYVATPALLRYDRIEPAAIRLVLTSLRHVPGCLA